MCMASNYPDDISYYKDVPWNEPELPRWECMGFSTCNECNLTGNVNEEQVCEDCFKPELHSRFEQ